MADVKRRELSINEALAHVGEFGRGQRIQTAVVSVNLLGIDYYI